MIYTDLTRKAMAVCYDAHLHQKDKSGMPYVFHPFHLAEQMPDETTTTAALLHDVIEDDPTCTMDVLITMNFPQEVLEAVELLTHTKGMPYLEYIQRLKSNRIARIVKLADLRHNSDLTRLKTVTEKDLERVAKYQKAIEILSDTAVPRKRVLIHAVIEDWADSGDCGQEIEIFSDVDIAQAHFKALMKKQYDDQFSLLNRWKHRGDYKEEYSQYGEGCDSIMLHERLLCRLEDYETYHYNLKLHPMMLQVDDPDEFIARIKSTKNI